jgi:hypothetical protein
MKTVMPGTDPSFIARMTSGRPLQERGGPLRGSLELAAGVYPRFLFGGGTGGILPVFHLHEVTRAFLEPRLQYLADNGYRTVTTEAVIRYVRDGIAPHPRSVVLTFDDAWVSLWTVAGPLLRRFGMTATVFVIPARLEDATACRPTVDDGGVAEPAGSPFVTWPELQALHDSGLFDVQSHTRSHAAIFCDSRPLGFVTPAYGRLPILERPLRAVGEPIRFVEPADLGMPLFRTRFRLSDASRFIPDADAVDRCRRVVDDAGGESFFAQDDWESRLRQAYGQAQGRMETAAERSVAIHEELALARDQLHDRIGMTSVRSVALPWGVAGAETRRAFASSGYEIAFAEGLWRLRAVAAGDDPFGLMRLNGKFVTCLPGRGRHWFFTAV